jgi:glutathione S-transferase
MVKKEVAPKQPVKFTYFALHAKGAACAIALAHSGLPWEGQFPDDWKTMKPTTPWGELPVLEIPGFGMIGHELQILAYIAREGPSFAQLAANEVLVSDQLVSQAEDIYLKLSKLQPTTKSSEPKCTPEELERFWTDGDDSGHNRTFGLNVYLAKLEKFLVEPVIPDVGLDKFTRSGFSVGECKLFAILDILRLIKGDVLGPYPGLSAFYARFAANEKTKAVLETGDKMPGPFEQYFVAA